MRYLFLLLLLLFLCTSGRAQNITITASIGLAEDQCNPVITNPNTDCINVPTGMDMLTYLPGQDGDIIITYRLTNNSGGTITQAAIDDTDRGVIVPVTSVSIPPGTTITTNRIFPAETLPRFVEATVKATLENAAGNSLNVESTYILDVVAPEVSVEFGVARQADVCDGEPVAPNCNVPYGALNGQTVTVGPLDTFTTRFAWTNDGLSTFDSENLVDQDNFQIANTGFDQPPGQTLISARHWEAPSAPGTYNYSQTLTVTDMAGNVATETVTYIVIVEAPMVSIEFGVARQADVCDGEPVAPNCNVPYGALNGQTVRVGARDTFTTRFAWTNTGLGDYDLINIVDQDDFQIANTGFDQSPGQTLISSRHWVAPDLAGTYNFSQILTITDQGGNVITETVTYIIIVEEPQVSIEFGVARQADVCDGEPVAPNCNVPYGALDGQTVTVGARDTFTTRFAWTNEGLGDYDLINIVDQDDFQIANTGFDQSPGQTLISSRHWEAPDLAGTYNFSQILTITDQGGNVIVKTVTYIIIVEEPQVSIEFGVARQADICDGEPVAPNCNVPYGAVNGQTVTVGARDTFTTRFAWTNEGLGDYDLINIVDQDDFQIANTGFDQSPGQTLISSRHWEAPDLPGTYNFSQILTITDQGGNVITATATYIIIVEAPMVSAEFGVANQNDVCPGETVAPNCPVSYGPLNGQQITVGAGDTVTTRFAWTNEGLGEWEELNVVDQDGNLLANTGFDQQPGQTLISAQHLIAPDEPGIYNWSQTLTGIDKGGNEAVVTVTFEVRVDCSLSDLAPPVALCRNRTITLVEGETRTINAGQIDNGSYDGCGNLAGGGIDINTFTCDDEGANTVTLTVGDLQGNTASCTSTVTVIVEDLIAEGQNNNCVSETHPVTGGQAINDLTINGQLVAQVIISGNDIDEVQVDVYKGSGTVESAGSAKYLSKRIALTMLNNGQEVQPNTDQIYVRLYYTAEEIAALQNSTPGSSEATYTIIKTSDDDCGAGYSGMNNSGMNTIIEGAGCSGNDRYFEFFTGTFSTFYLFSTSTVLPVELTEFTATALPKERVQLDWMTVSESGNSHFDVERSTDGRNFTFLGAVAGAGDSGEEQWYDFVDEAAVPGRNYYRLRQVDFDGTETLSEVRQVMVEGNTRLSVYPNPAVNELRLAGFAGGVVRILDGQGRLLLEQNLSEGEALSVEHLKPGFYLLQTPGETIRWIKN